MTSDTTPPLCRVIPNGLFGPLISTNRQHRMIVSFRPKAVINTFADLVLADRSEKCRRAGKSGTGFCGLKAGPAPAGFILEDGGAMDYFHRQGGADTGDGGCG